MRRLQTKLFLVLAGLVLLVVVTSGALAERGLRAQAQAQLERALARRAALAAELLADVSAPDLAETLRRVARAGGVRVTLVGPDGTAVADSDTAREQLGALGSLADRPEVRAALTGQTGTSTRMSEALGRPLVHVAVPISAIGRGGGLAGALRVAADLPDVGPSVSALRGRLAVAAGIGLAGALLLSFVLSRPLLRSFAQLQDVLGRFADGDLAQRLRWRTSDERRDVAGAVNAMAARLEARVHDLTGEKEQLRAVLDGMVEGVLVLSPRGRLLLVNRALRDLLGVWSDVEGKLPLEVIRIADIDAVLNEARRSARPISRALELGPGERSVEINAVPLGPHAGTAGVVAVFHDTTELRRLEAMRRDFVANASHELKTPVTAIRGYAELLATHEVREDERRKQLGVVVQHAERLSRLVEDLLELSRIEGGRMQPELVDVDLIQIAREIVEDLEPMFADRKVGVRLVDAAGPVTARADRRAVEQVLRNLLDNAAKYTDPGGHVSLRITASNGQARVDIEDDGIGIPDDLQARIFERFYRVDAARSRALGGTGLGLAIVKHLVQACGGDIRLRSTPGEGSTFTITLPRPH